MEPLRGLACLPFVLAVGVASHVRRLIVGETIEERLRRCYPDGQFVTRFDDIPDWVEP